MNQTDVKVSFYLKKSEADARGNCPVMARLIVGKHSETAFSVKLRVSQSLWSSGRACGKSVAAREINNRLDEIRAAALSIYAEQSVIRESVTAEDVKHQLLGMASEQETLLSYFRLFIRNFEKRVGINRTEKTLRAYRNSYNHLVRFLQVQYKLSDIPFAALDRSFIEKYDRTECCLASGTIVNLTVQLKTIVGEAIADGIITVFPFVGYEPVHPKPEQKYLTSEELNRIMTTPLHDQILYHVRDMFLFSCYTGIPYSDMCLLTNENLSLAEDGYRDMAPEGKLLPMYSNSSLNRYLKRIAEICGIGRKLVFHAARHTYATEITLSHGVPLETVSKMLGHMRIETTQLYAKVTGRKVDEDMKRLKETGMNRISGLYEEEVIARKRRRKFGYQLSDNKETTL